MMREVFISHSTQDRADAEFMCRALEHANITCWMAERDILPGSQWVRSIMEAIGGSTVVLLILSTASNASKQVAREIERASDRAIPIIPVRIEDIKPSADLEFFVGNTQWLDAFRLNKPQFVDQLLKAVTPTVRNADKTFSANDTSKSKFLSLEQAAAEPSSVSPSSQRRLGLDAIPNEFAATLMDVFEREDDASRRVKVTGTEYSIGHGDVAVAAITAPLGETGWAELRAAEAIARKACARGLKARPWVKASMTLGSAKMHAKNPYKQLRRLGFAEIEMSKTSSSALGPWLASTMEAIKAGNLVAAAVFSGEGNLNGYIPQGVRVSYRMSAMLVVAYTIAGSVNIDLSREPVGYDSENEPVYLAEIWPSEAEQVSLAQGL